MSEPSSASEVYARLLLPKRHGYPLFIAEPDDNLPLEYRTKGTSIGDVGIITADGSFDFVFNICVSYNDPVNCYGVPDGFEHVTLDPKDISLLSTMHPPGSDISSASVKKTNITVEGSQKENELLHMPAGVNAGYSFTSTSSEAAILALPEGAGRQNLRNLTKFRRHAIQNTLRWYQFVNSTLGREAPNGSLYLVTGCDKSTTWGITSVSGVYGSNVLSLKATAAQIAEAHVSYSYSWETHCPATVRVGPEPRGNLDRLQNQCVFLRGFKMTVREGPMAALMGPVKLSSIVGSKSGDILSGSNGNRPPFMDDGKRFWSSKGSSSGGSAGSYQRSHSPPTPSDSVDEDVILEFIPGTVEAYHPLNAVNKHLLASMPDAQVAVTHETDWWILCNDDKSLPTDEELIGRLQSRYCTLMESGGVFLIPKDSGQPDNHASESEAGSPMHQSPALSDGVDGPPDEIHTRLLLPKRQGYPLFETVVQLNLMRSLNTILQAAQGNADHASYPNTITVTTNQECQGLDLKMLSDLYGIFPQYLPPPQRWRPVERLTLEHDSYSAHGGLSNVWKGLWKDTGNSKVVVTVLRINEEIENDHEKMKKRLHREQNLTRNDRGSFIDHLAQNALVPQPSYDTRPLIQPAWCYKPPKELLNAFIGLNAATGTSPVSSILDALDSEIFDCDNDSPLLIASDFDSEVDFQEFPNFMSDSLVVYTSPMPFTFDAWSTDNKSYDGVSNVDAPPQEDAPDSFALTGSHHRLPDGRLHKTDPASQRTYYIYSNAHSPLSTWLHPYEGRQPLSSHPYIRQVTNQPQPYTQFQNVGAPPNRVNHPHRAASANTYGGRQNTAPVDMRPRSEGHRRRARHGNSNRPIGAGSVFSQEPVRPTVEELTADCSFLDITITQYITQYIYRGPEHQFSIGGGAGGDVYRGVYHRIDPDTPQEQRINIVTKCLVGTFESKEKIEKKLNCEIAVFRNLKRPNVAELLVIVRMNPNLPPGLVRYVLRHDFLGYIGRHPERERRKAQEVASGVQYLHENGVVHGNLEADNLLISDNHVAQISDFGIACILDVKGFTTSIQKNVRYTAPELMSISDQDVRPTLQSDVFSLGPLFPQLRFHAGSDVWRHGGKPYHHILRDGRQFTSNPTMPALVSYDGREMLMSDAIDEDQAQFRQYEDAYDRNKGFYKEQHENQTMDFNIIKVRVKKRALIGVWGGIEMLNKLVDESDPDTLASQIEHMLQTAEAIRRDGKPDWMQLTALVHDLGKLWCMFGSEGQWDVIGDTFVVGCNFSDKNIYLKIFNTNANSKDPMYSSEYGVYQPRCRLDNVMLSWDHKEYLYSVPKDQSSHPEEGLAMIRHHSFYPWHCDCVCSVALSPDGARIVSGSDDQTIRVWDALTGNIVSGPFKGNTHWVRSVVFSPDGARIVSGSDDKTISNLAQSLNSLSNRLGDLGRREDALEAILESVDLYRKLAADRPAAFNPDLAKSLSILSNRLRDLGRREGALEAILESVDLRRKLAADCPAAFNPDLARSLSNLSNRLGDPIGVRDVLTDNIVSGPFEGHTDGVNSVAFSPDGICIISGSD